MGWWCCASGSGPVWSALDFGVDLGYGVARWDGMMGWVFGQEVGVGLQD